MQVSLIRQKFRVKKGIIWTETLSFSCYSETLLILSLKNECKVQMGSSYSSLHSTDL